MTEQPSPRRVSAGLLIELFVLGNLAFLTLDVYLAHSINAFHNPLEWLPIVVSAIGALLVLIELPRSIRQSENLPVRPLGWFVGVVCIVLGVAGMVLHLRDTFFHEMTLKNLVYIAPFAAPLAYAGLGFLLILNRMISPQRVEWSQWVVFFCLGGFLGNFALSICDHAQNGFFHATEWIPVIAAALAVGMLFSALVQPVSSTYLFLCTGFLLVQMAVGALGFFLHVQSTLMRGGENWWLSVIHGAPVFAPLLFADIAILGIIGLLTWRSLLIDEQHTAASEEPSMLTPTAVS